MKFKIMQDFHGSQDGCAVTEFKAGTEIEISDHLAPHIGAWATPAESVEVENKAVITDGSNSKPRKPRLQAKEA